MPILKQKHKEKKPKHIAITTDGITEWAKQNKKSLEEAYKKSFSLITKTIQEQLKLKIPVLTFNIFSTSMLNLEHFSIVIDSLIEYLNSLLKSEFIHKYMVKFYVLGKWYDLPGRIVEPIKKLMEETGDYDNFFVNFCINYDGQEEIVNAAKLIARQIKAEKLLPEQITKETIKENLFSSYFIPPDIIIKNGNTQIPNCLLWDIPYSKIFFTKKLWPDFSLKDFYKAINTLSKE